MDQSSSQTYLKQPQENSKSYTNKDNSQTQVRSTTYVRSDHRKNENGVFKDSELLDIEFIVDNIKYTLDPRYMLWSTELLRKDEPQDQNQLNQEIEQITRKSHKSMDLKKLFELNKTLIENLNREINDLELNRQKLHSRLAASREEKDKYMRILKAEHIKTENIKGCKERLDKLKRELGL